MQLAKHRVLATQSLSTVNLFANMAAGDLAPSTPAMSVDLTTEDDRLAPQSQTELHVLRNSQSTQKHS